MWLLVLGGVGVVGPLERPSDFSSKCSCNQQNVTFVQSSWLYHTPSSPAKGWEAVSCVLRPRSTSEQGDWELKITTEIKPRASGSRTRNIYQRKVDDALKAIAELKSRDGDSVSETAIFLKLTDGFETTVSRDAVRDAFQVLTDMGIASPVFDRNGRRLTTLWTFHESFGPEEVRNVIGWDGSAATFKDEGETTER